MRDKTMRTEPEILDLILNTAKYDRRIRAAVLSGSRANPQARQDIFQDFDVTYFVTDVEPFKHCPSWIHRFGEILILQMPEAMGDPPPRGDGRFVYLMQFTDGHRIDLTLMPLVHLAHYTIESASVLLLDKDGLLGQLPPASEADYLPTRPTAKAFEDCCNEFWWVCPYVAKGLWREQIIYTRHIFDHPVRAQLMQMLTWYAGVKTGFQVNLGTHGKHLQQHLEPELWELLKRSYAGAEIEATWAALLAAGAVFRMAATPVAAHFGFQYPRHADKKVSAYLAHIRSLPREAAAIYEPYSEDT